MTFAPRAFARSTAARPTPPAAPCTSTHEGDVGGEIGCADGGGFGVAEVFRLAADRGGGKQGELGEPAQLGPADHRIADRELCHPLAQGHDIARQFHPADERQRRLHLVLAAGHQQVREVDAGRADPDQHLAGARRRGRNVAQGDAGVVRTQAVDDERAHFHP
jgi:hypothetical protein